MGQASPFKPIALVVEDDVLQRELAVVLLEECEMGVIECENAKGALRVFPSGCAPATPGGEIAGRSHRPAPW